MLIRDIRINRRNEFLHVEVASLVLVCDNICMYALLEMNIHIY